MIATVIPINTDNAARAEALLAWIFQLNSRQQRGHVLLVFEGVHDEFRARLKIASDLAFESVEEFLPPSKDTPLKMASEIARRNNMFLSAAEHCQKCFRCPWLWLEPESTPTNPQWMTNIEAAYDNQPRRYLLTHLKPSAESTDRFPLAVGVWHMGSFNDLAKLCAENPEIPFEQVAGMHIVSRSTKSRLFQPLKIQDEADFEKVWPEAQVVAGDVAAGYIEFLREKGVHLPKPYLSSASPEKIAERFPDIGSDFDIASAPKIDRRTKAGRELKAAKNGHEKVKA